jgi:hypothetical protein
MLVFQDFMLSFIRPLCKQLITLLDRNISETPFLNTCGAFEVILHAKSVLILSIDHRRDHE